MAVDKAQLLKANRCAEDDVEIPGIGTVRVRGLTRAEIMRISKGVSEGKNMEPLSLSLALVDPKMTEDEAAQWLEVAGFGEIEAVNQRINELSGIAGRADKEAYKSIRK